MSLMDTFLDHNTDDELFPPVPEAPLPSTGGPTPHSTVHRGIAKDSNARQRDTARRHGNDDDTGVITAAWWPPFGKEPAPVATPAALSRSLPDPSLKTAKTTGTDDVSHRPPHPSLGTPQHSAIHHRHPPHHLFATAKTAGTDDAAWLVPRAPPLPRLTKPGTTAHVTTSAEHLDGAAPNTTDFGGTVPPPPGTPGNVPRRLDNDN
ncbi:hypothetical protein WOLCODRAFT_159054 [Wolfiporia cocos MD-104 SS10]|uniref:Uncharacterized protein n=1 Tax=Wolfiporia cocos (strain MD-104) TaxID=742152 RepID=A0A2H3JB54_WOLCO|nr:hypothetical protein WOLCODRAFT_159054 [Wolfiporia cocos MD-104 SS10]